MPISSIQTTEPKCPSDSTRLPKQPARGVSEKEQSFSYERAIQTVLSDRQGRKSWPVLEDLERRAVHDPLARGALFRLETLDAAREFSEADQKKQEPVRLAALLDRCDPRTQREGWCRVLGAGSASRSFPVLRASAKKTGWRLLGYPPCVGKQVGPSSRALEDPERFSNLVSLSLKKRLRPGSEDPRLKEYRQLREAHKKVSSGKVRARVSERSLYLDMKLLEEELLPEHIEKAKADAKTRVLGDTQHEGFRPESKVRRFLGTLSALPDNSRERHMFLELSRVATRDPKELRGYAAHVLDELKKCRGSLSDQLLPDFRRALARVSRLQGERRVERRRLGSSASFQDLLQALDGPNNSNGSLAAGGELNVYRSGLTVNGTTRDYTY